MASAPSPVEGDLFAATVADAPNTLGGIKDDVEPPHDSVIGHIGAA